MNILKFGRGEFFGIIIPGAFLLINIIAFYPLSKLGINQSQLVVDKKEGLIVTSLFVISYILGYALRLIKPGLIEKASFIFRLPDIVCLSIRKSIKEEISFYKALSKFLKYYNEPYPYIDWFYDSYLNMTPASFSSFFNELLRIEFYEDRRLMKKFTFINQCKLFVRRKSNSLNDEIMFSEGLVRFLSGISWALIISIIMLIMYDPNQKIILYSYILLAIFFIRPIKHIRTKEVTTILTAFASSINKI